MSTNSTHPASDLAVEFEAVHHHLHAEGDRDVALQRLVELATSWIPGCDSAGITAWPVGRKPFSLATSDDTAATIDQLQYEVGDGPCLSASTRTAPVHVPDVSVDERWPRFCAAVQARTPVRGVLSFHLVDEPTRCALNLYAGRAGAFGSEGISTGSLFATHARVLVMHADSVDKAANLSVALATSRQIGAAVGILMGAHKISADEAFAMLRGTSQQLHRKLREVASDVTHTGTLPGLP